MKCKKGYLFSAVVFLIFSLISGICLIFRGDDFIWYFVNELEHLEKWKFPNGRYFTNPITYFMMRNDLFRIPAYCFFLVVFLLLVLKLFDYYNKNTKFSTSVISAIFLLSPSLMYASVFNWVSGFTNYVISLIFTFSYMVFCYRLYDEKIEFKRSSVVFTFIIGFLGALCVEHISFYNIAFGIFIIVYTKIKHKKIYGANISFLIASVFGTILMLTNPQYGIILGEGKDSISPRFLDLSLSDIFAKVYIYILPSFTKSFVCLNFLLLIGIVVLFLKSGFSAYSKSSNRYIKICFGICCSYTMYSLFSCFFCNFEITSQAMKGQAIETAFMFLYIVALVYLAYILLSGSRRVRAIMYILSSVFTIIPFLVVNPVTPRCFFAGYCLLLLAAGEFIFASMSQIKDASYKYISSAAMWIASACAVCICYINISNFYCGNLRFDYIKEQLEAEAPMVEVIKLPYPDYGYDIFKSFMSDENEADEVHYETLYFLYYGIDMPTSEFNFMEISIYDYNSLHE